LPFGVSAALPTASVVKLAALRASDLLGFSYGLRLYTQGIGGLHLLAISLQSLYLSVCCLDPGLLGLTCSLLGLTFYCHDHIDLWSIITNLKIITLQGLSSLTCVFLGCTSALRASCLLGFSYGLRLYTQGIGGLHVLSKAPIALQ